MAAENTERDSVTAADVHADLDRRRAEADRVHGPVCEGCGRRGCANGCDPDCRA